MSHRSALSVVPEGPLHGHRASSLSGCTHKTRRLLWLQPEGCEDMKSKEVYSVCVKSQRAERVPRPSQKLQITLLPSCPFVLYLLLQ